jgi:hypothetical protein
MLAIGREGVNETALFHVEQCGKRQNIRAGLVAELPGTRCHGAGPAADPPGRAQAASPSKPRRFGCAALRSARVPLGISRSLQRVTSSGSSPVAAPQTQACRLPRRPGPIRRHPQERNDTSRLISFLGRERGG